MLSQRPAISKVWQRTYSEYFWTVRLNSNWIEIQPPWLYSSEAAWTACFSSQTRPNKHQRALSLELSLRMHPDESSLFAIYGTAETLHCCMLSQQTPRDLTLFADHKVMPRMPIYSLFDLERLTQIVHIIKYRVTVTRYKNTQSLECIHHGLSHLWLNLIWMKIWTAIKLSF